VGNGSTSGASRESATEIPEIIKDFFTNAAEIERLLKIAQTGPVKSEDVDKACDFVRGIQENSPGERSSLECYSTARELRRFFVDRWLSPNSPRKQQITAIKNDWRVVNGRGAKGFSELLNIYPNAPKKEIDEILKLKGLLRWLEDELVLLLAGAFGGTLS